MKKLSVILLGLLLAACSGKDVDPTMLSGEQGSAGTVTVSKAHRILVLPFDCNIMPEGSEGTAILLQNQLSAQVVYMLQSASVPADQYILDTGGTRSLSYSTFMPDAYAPEGGVLPTPVNAGASGAAATSFEEVTDWDAVVVPPRDTRQFGTPIEYVEIGDTDYAAPAGADASAENKTGYLSRRDRIISEARENGYDYVVGGTIALVRTDVSPSIHVAGAERATIRTELNCSFQVIDAQDGKVVRAGAAKGRDAKMIMVKDDRLNTYHLQSALDKVMDQAIFYAAKKIAEEASGRNLDSVITKNLLEDEDAYYKDTPGKRLRSTTY